MHYHKLYCCTEETEQLWAFFCSGSNVSFNGPDTVLTAAGVEEYCIWRDTLFFFVAALVHYCCT
jgi:hypothetical protein